jgi:hypothetical protein
MGASVAFELGVQAQFMMNLMIFLLQTPTDSQGISAHANGNRATLSQSKNHKKFCLINPCRPAANLPAVNPFMAGAAQMW